MKATGWQNSWGNKLTHPSAIYLSLGAKGWWSGKHGHFCEHYYLVGVCYDHYNCKPDALKSCKSVKKIDKSCSKICLEFLVWVPGDLKRIWNKSKRFYWVVSSIFYVMDIKGDPSYFVARLCGLWHMLDRTNCLKKNWLISYKT